MIDAVKKHQDLLLEILAIILIIVYAISITPKTLQNDTFYTVSVGKLISENGIDFKDHFSWHEGLSYTYPHWLYDLGMYYIYNLGGWTGIYISTCVLASILGLCIYKVNSRISKNSLVSFFVTIGSLYLLKGYITARAQLATFILFILLVYNIEKFLENKKFKNVFALLIIQTLIANLHVAVWPFTFVLYLPYIGEYLIYKLAEIILYHKLKIFILEKRLNRLQKQISKKEGNEKLIAKKNKIEQKLEIIKSRANFMKETRDKNLNNSYKIKLQKNKAVKWLIVILIISIFTGFLTPLGNTPFTYTYLTIKGNTTQNINEHLPMILAENEKILCTIIIFIGIMTFTKTKIKLSDLFMIGGIGYLMLASRRQASMFALICTIPLTRMITDMFLIYNNESGQEIVKKRANGMVIFLVSIITISMSLNNFSKKKNDSYINTNSYPVEAAEWILDNLDLENIRLYNEYNFGSYLLYKGIPVFIDSRADLYAPEFNTKTDNPDDGQDIFNDFINSSNIGTYYGKIFEKYDITHLIIKSNSKMNMLIKNADSEKYELLYSDKNFVIYKILEY